MRLKTALSLKSNGHSVEFVTSHHDKAHCFEVLTLLLVTSGCLAVVYSAWSAIAALHLSVIVFSLDLELRLLHSFGTIGESSIEHR